VPSGRSEERVAIADKWLYMDLQMREIGLVVRNFSWLESTLKEAVCEYLRLDTLKCFTLTAHMGFRQCLDLLWSFYKTDRKFRRRQPAGLEGVLKRVEQAERDRNELLHSEWHPERYKKRDVRLRQVRITSRKGLNVSLIEGRDLTDVRTIHGIAQRIYHLNIQLRRSLRLSIKELSFEVDAGVIGAYRPRTLKSRPKGPARETKG